MSPAGVSVLLCSHNGAARLPETLAHLRDQEGLAEIPWEVVVVDNASTDGTAAAARAAWPDPGPAPLRVLSEAEPGKSVALERGRAAARYGVLAIVDDDNRLAPDYLAVALRVLRENPRVGACGGFGDAVCEGGEPDWLGSGGTVYALGPQAAGRGVLRSPRSALWGAGQCVRARAWTDLVEGGFRQTLRSRRGAVLSSGGDLELCYALRLAGWDLWYEPDLRFRHFLTADRLRWDACRGLKRAAGRSSVRLDRYSRLLAERSGEKRSRRRSAAYQILRAVRRLGRYPGLLTDRARARRVGDPRVLDVEQQLGRLEALRAAGRSYARSHRELAGEPWLRGSSRP